MAHIDEANLIGVSLKDGEERLAIRTVTTREGRVQIDCEDQRTHQRGALVIGIGHEFLLEVWGTETTAPKTRNQSGRSQERP